MSRVAALISAAGIDPRQGVTEAAALLVRRFPLRLGGPEQRGTEEIVESGWCSGLEAFAELMTLVTAVPCQWGTGFGARWPWLEVRGALVAPGLPVRLTTGMEELGPDGVYTFDGDAIYREAAGRSGYFLGTCTSVPKTTPELTLLWFSETARFLLRDSVLEIEDLFSKTRTSIDGKRLEQILIRGQRVGGAVIEGVSFDLDQQPTTVEVARAWGGATAPWRDPTAFLESKIDVEKVKRSGDRAVVKDVRGEMIEFRVTDQASGWLLERKEGLFPYEALSIEKDGEHLVLGATIAPEHDIFTPGLRGRVVFDLNADLTAFQKL